MPTVTARVADNQAHIYRLSGDYNPLHIDPDAARFGGFDVPILHGLCTFGHCAQLLLDALAGGDPARFRKIKVRFSAPVLLDEDLDVRAWNDGDGRVVFEARARDQCGGVERLLRARELMQFAFSDEQEQLRLAVRRFLTDQSPPSEVRRLMATDAGYDPNVWRQLCNDLALAGVHIPEAYGGQGFSSAELAIVTRRDGPLAALRAVLLVHGVGGHRDPERGDRNRQDRATAADRSG